MSASDEKAANVPLTARFLGGLVTAVSARPRLTVWCVLTLACAAVAVTVAHLTIKTSRADLVDPAAEFARSWREYSETFGGTSDLIVVVETRTSNPQLIQTVLNDLGQRVEREPQLFSNVLYRIEQESLRRKALQFLSTSQLQRTAERIDRYNPVVRDQQWDLLRTENLVSSLRQSIVRAEQKGAASPALYRSAQRVADSLSRFQQQSQNGMKFEAAAFYSPLSELLSVGADDGASDADVAYLMNPQATMGLLQVFPVAQKQDLNENSRSIQKLRELMQSVTADYRSLSGELKLSLTGIPVLEHDEMQRTTADMLNAALIAFVAVSALLFLGFRGLRHPMLAMLTLVVGICWTFGVSTLVIGHLNMLSVAFAAILIGLGIEFPIHFLSRYLALRQDLYDLRDALRMTARTVGSGILMSAVTTALAFGSALLTGVPGLAELGLISAIGILLCALASFVFLPALVALADTGLDVEALPQPVSNAWYRRLIVAWPVVVLAVCGVGLGGFASQAFRYTDGSVSCRVNYDANLINLHDEQLESVQAERRLFASANESLLYAVAVAPSWEEALRLRNEFQRLPSVGRVSELASRLPLEPGATQRQWIQQLQQRVNSLPRTSPSFQRVQLNTVGREVEKLYLVLKDSPDVTARQAATTLDGFLTALENMPGDKATAMLEAYQMLVARSLLQELGKVATATAMEPVRPGDLPRALRDRYVRVDGDRQSWLIRVYPKQPIWDAQPLEEFVRDVRSVAPQVTGVPIQNYESASLLHHSYKTLGWYSLAVISLFLLYDFLRPGQKLLTVLPPIAVAAFIGYTMHQRNGTVNPHLVVGICMGLMVFIAAVLDYRNLRDSVLAMLPSVGGVVILLGTMALAGLELNPVNLMVLPLILGIGVDTGIHLVQDYRRQVAAGAETYSPSADTINGILMTSLTSIVGFGSLMVAAHRGLFSVGMLLSIGIAGSLFIGLVPLPAVLALVARYQPASMEPVLLRAPKADDAEAGGTTARAPAQKQRKAA